MAKDTSKKRRVFGKGSKEREEAPEPEEQHDITEEPTSIMPAGGLDSEPTMMLGEDLGPPESPEKQRNVPSTELERPTVNVEKSRPRTVGRTEEEAYAPTTPSSSEVPQGRRKPEPPTQGSTQQGRSGPASTQMASRSGESVSRHAPPTIQGYKLIDRLGAGTFGSVWRAKHLRTQAEVAVKLFDRKIGADWDYLRREIECLLSVGKHANVITLMDADFFQDPPFYSMELVSTSMDAEMRKHHKEVLDGKTREEKEQVEWIPWPHVDQAIRWFEGMVEGLLYVHSRAFIHCDLKPGNVLIDEQDTVRIVDFGQALLTGRNEVSLGTLFFMPPEQTELEQGEKFHPSTQWDVYGLGATIYTLLTGRPPRAGRAQMRSISTAASVKEKLKVYRVQLASTPLVPISRINPAVPPEFAAIISKCLEIDPEDRYHSVAEIKQDIERMKNRMPMLCYRPWTRGYLAKRFILRNAMWLVPVFALLLVLIISQWYIILLYQRQDWAIVTMYEGEGEFTETRVQGTKGLGKVLDDAQVDLYLSKLQEAEDLMMMGKGEEANDVLRRVKPLARGWEWTRIRYLATMNNNEGPPPPDLGVETITGLPRQSAFQQPVPNGFIIVVNWPYGKAEAYNTKEGGVDPDFRINGQDPRSLSIGDDGKTAAALMNNGEIYVRQTPHFKWEFLTNHPTAQALAVSPDMGRIASIDGSGTIKVHILQTGHLVYETTGGPMDTIHAEFSPSGNKLIFYNGEGKATLYQGLAQQ